MTQGSAQGSPVNTRRPPDLTEGKGKRPVGRKSGGPLDKDRVWRTKHEDRLEGVSDDAEFVGDLAAQEDQGDDRDDGDECKDQRVLGKALTLLV